MITNSPSLYLILNLLQNPHKINWLFLKKKKFHVRKSSQKSTANHAPRKWTVFRCGNEVELSSPSNPLGEKMTLARTCRQIVHVFQPCPEDTETWTGLPTTAGWAVTGRLASLYFLGKHEGKHLAFLVWSWFVSLKCVFFFRKENCIEITSKTKDPHCLVGSRGFLSTLHVGKEKQCSRRIMRVFREFPSTSFMFAYEWGNPFIGEL